MWARVFEMYMMSGWTARCSLSTTSIGLTKTLPNFLALTNSFSRLAKLKTISWCEGVGAGDIMISPSQSSVGELLSGSLAAIWLNVQNRRACGLGTAAVAIQNKAKQIRARNQLFASESSWILKDPPGIFGGLLARTEGQRTVRAKLYPSRPGADFFAPGCNCLTEQG